MEVWYFLLNSKSLDQLMNNHLTNAFRMQPAQLAQTFEVALRPALPICIWFH